MSLSAAAAAPEDQGAGRIAAPFAWALVVFSSMVDESSDWVLTNPGIVLYWR